MRARVMGIAWLVFAFIVLPARAQEPPAKAKAAQGEAAKAAPAKTAEKKATTKSPTDLIRDEGLNRSQVMRTLSYLTDVIGPRLTGTPSLKRANEWTREKLASWGLANAHLHKWGPFGRGWTLRRFSAQIIEPQCIPLIAFPKAWSPGTNGPLVSEIVYVDAKTEADLKKYKGKLKGKVVLTSPPKEDVKAHFDPLATRFTEKDLLRLANAGDPRLDSSPFSLRFRGGNPQMRSQFALRGIKAQFFLEEGVALTIDPSTVGDGGTIFVQGASVPQAVPENPEPGGLDFRRRAQPWQKETPRLVPQIVCSIEQYNRMVRMIEQGEKLKVAIELDVQYHSDDLMCYNTIAEIPGSDLKDEIVMLGGHLDSWHSGTGATDNAAGVAVAMEAVRILQAAKLKPRRTIRIGLWTGEEQGLLGSQAYVAEHFGSMERGEPAARSADPKVETPRKDARGRRLSKKPAYDQFCAYFNLDNGTGKIRGIYLQGNEAARPIFRQWLTPFVDLGADTISLSNTGGTDHQSFDRIGLPGFQFIQDQLEYSTRTHHSNQDVYERLQADDMKQASVIMAAFVYNAAMRNEKIPRKPLQVQ